MAVSDCTPEVNLASCEYPAKRIWAAQNSAATCLGKYQNWRQLPYAVALFTGNSLGWLLVRGVRSPCSIGAAMQTALSFSYAEVIFLPASRVSRMGLKWP
jgi:hypothetical protein